MITRVIGWSSEAMCGVYTDIDDEEMFDRYFGADGIKSVENKSLADL